MVYVCPDCGFESSEPGTCPNCETPLLRRGDPDITGIDEEKDLDDEWEEEPEEDKLTDDLW